MKLAIPVFGTKISPRFDQAQEFALLQTGDAGVTAREQITAKQWPVYEKMKQLVTLEIDTLICGGIDRASLQYLTFNGIEIYSWVTGEVDDAVACYLNNNMKPGIIVGEKGQMKGRWQFCKGRNHLCNMFQINPYQGEEEVDAMSGGNGMRQKGRRSGSGKGRGVCRSGKGVGGQGKRQGSYNQGTGRSGSAQSGGRNRSRDSEES